MAQLATDLIADLVGLGYGQAGRDHQVEIEQYLAGHGTGTQLMNAAHPRHLLGLEAHLALLFLRQGSVDQFPGRVPQE